MALAFYERASILIWPEHPDRIGSEGYVLGKSYVDDDPGGEVAAYGVFIEDLGRAFSFQPHALVGTGEIADRSRFYPE